MLRPHTEFTFAMVWGDGLSVVSCQLSMGERMRWFFAALRMTSRGNGKERGIIDSKGNDKGKGKSKCGGSSLRSE